MTVENMHILFKTGLDKVDARGNRNIPPELIDLYLNAGQSMFIKRAAFPTVNKRVYGFEFNQRITDSLRSLVVDDYQIMPLQVVDDITSFELPSNYMYHIKSDAIVKDGCNNDVRCKVIIRQHSDNIRNSVFDRSSLLWRFVNGIFGTDNISGNIHDTLKIIADFDIEYLLMSYLRKPAYIAYGSYSLPDGTTTVHQDCELPDVAHDEIVNLAVLVAKGDLELPTIQYKMMENQLMGN